MEEKKTYEQLEEENLDLIQKVSSLKDRVNELKDIVRRQNSSDEKYKSGDYEGFYKEEFFIALHRIQHLLEDNHKLEIELNKLSAENSTKRNWRKI